MKVQQLVRIDKIYNEPIYLLTKKKEFNKYIFEICGSTKNIYKVQIYTTCKMIYCNCPDAKSYSKTYGVLCKHCCFILLKVLKLNDSESFFNTLFLNEIQLIHIESIFNILEFKETDYIKMDYISKFNNLKDHNIIVKLDQELMCIICYDDLEDIENKNINNQCKCCLKIFHNKCLNKWLNLGNDTCPHCRYTIKSNNNIYKSLD